MFVIWWYNLSIKNIPKIYLYSLSSIVFAIFLHYNERVCGKSIYYGSFVTVFSDGSNCSVFFFLVNKRWVTNFWNIFFFCRKRLVEEERKRMLQEHVKNLIGYLPKGILKPSDLSYLGGDLFSHVDKRGAV